MIQKNNALEDKRLRQEQQKDRGLQPNGNAPNKTKIVPF